MRLYAQTPLRRYRQQLADVTLLAWCLVWLLISRFIHGLVSDLAGPGRLLEDAGRTLTGSMREVSATVGDVPVAGGGLQAPFDVAGGVGDTLRQAGQTQQDVVATLALWLALVIAVLPIGWALFRWLPGRFHWIREASAAQRLVDDTELFAVRALANRPLSELVKLGAAPATAWRSGDVEITHALARLELTALGFVPPAQKADRPTKVW